MHDARDVPVLVVEDDDDTREVLRLLLMGEGYHVLEARDGREGLDLLRETRGPLVALVDWWMPRMNGLQLLGAAARLAQGRRKRYVLVSATCQPHDLERSGLPSLLDVSVLRKPFDIEEVLDEVARQAASAACDAEDDGRPDSKSAGEGADERHSASVPLAS